MDRGVEEVKQLAPCRYRNDIYRESFVFAVFTDLFIETETIF
jgi:hypothetical protein